VQTPLVADVGTGSGAVAVSLAYYNAHVRLVATDISPAALQLAKRNARRHGVTERVEFLQGDLLTPLLQQGTTAYRIDMADRPGIIPQRQQRSIGIGTAVAANLPYIPTADLQSLPLDVQYEPLNALDGGEDGLDHYRRLIPQAAAFLAPKGLLACEVGIGQAELLAELLTKEGWTETEIIKDYAGKERIVTAKRGQA
jgi:release factor glutamine methyltransferase